MRRTRLFTGCLVLSVGCAHALDAPPGVLVETTLNRAVAAAGDTVSLAVRVTNSSNRSYKVAGSKGGCIAIIEVRRADGAAISASAPRICDAAAALHLLDPGQSRNDRLRWILPLGAEGITPGRYRVRTSVAVAGYGLATSAFQDISVGTR